MPLAYQQTWQNGSAREVERQRQHRRQPRQQQQRLLQRRRPPPQHLQRRQPLAQHLQRRRPPSQHLRRRHYHQEFDLRQHRALAQHHRLAHNGCSRFAVRSASHDCKCGRRATHGDAATVAFYLMARPALRYCRSVRSRFQRLTKSKKSRERLCVRFFWRDSQDRGSGSYAPATADTQTASHTATRPQRAPLGKNQSLITDRSNVSSSAKQLLLAFFPSACSISGALNRRTPAAIRHKEIPNAGA